MTIKLCLKLLLLHLEWQYLSYNFITQFKVLINVGPAKPKHKLPEAERKALLSDGMEVEGANQSAEHDDTPQIEPYIETSFNTNEPNSAVSL